MQKAGRPLSQLIAHTDFEIYVLFKDDEGLDGIGEDQL